MYFLKESISEDYDSLEIVTTLTAGFYKPFTSKVLSQLLIFSNVVK